MFFERIIQATEFTNVWKAMENEPGEKLCRKKNKFATA